MKFSMSQKIFGVVILLLALAAGITALGLYGINRLHDEANGLGRRSGRAVALNLMDRILLEREIAVNDILRSNSVDAKKRIVDERLKAEEAQMEDMLARYRRYFSPAESAMGDERVAEIRRRWKAFVDATLETANLSLVNSNLYSNCIFHFPHTVLGENIQGRGRAFRGNPRPGRAGRGEMGH